MNANPNKSGVPDAIIFLNSVTTLYINNSPSCLTTQYGWECTLHVGTFLIFVWFIKNKIEKSEKSNYRPILFPSCMSKILEK